MTVSTIGDLFGLAAKRGGATVAVVDDGKATTYAELQTHVEGGALALRHDHRLRAGDRAIIVAGNSVDFLAGFLSCAVAGVVAVPVSTQLTARELAYIVGHSRPSIILVERDRASIVTAALAIAELETTPSVVDIDALKGSGEAPGNATDFSDVTPDNVLYLGYTSGTTGRPKGVKVTHRNRVDAVLLQAAEFQLGRSQSHLVVSPLYHTAPLTFALLHLCLGATVIVHRGFDAARMAEDLFSGQVSSVFLAPAALKRIMSAATLDAPPDPLHAVIIGGAPCPTDVKSAALARFPGRLYEFYGATEVGIVTSLRPDEQVERPSSAGHPIPGSAIEIRDPSSDQLLPRRQVGAVWVSTATTSSGYFGETDPGPTDRWSNLGDIGYLDDDDFVHLVDRTTDIIISGGVNVYSREVEAVLEGHFAVSEVAVLGVPDAEWGEAVVAAVVLAAGASVTHEELVSYCRGQLAAYKLPKHVLFVDALPRSQFGKTDKRALRGRFALTTHSLIPE